MSVSFYRQDAKASERLPQVESWDQNSGPLTPRKDLVVLLDWKLYVILT